MTMKAWVLWHRYSDGSNAHIERVYLDSARGAEDLALMKAAAEVGAADEWRLDEVNVFGPENAAHPYRQILPQNPSGILGGGVGQVGRI